MKKTILFFTLILCIAVNAQTAFEKGNFVNKQNQTVECLIKNYDWASIPKEIEYKINENDEAITLPASQLTSFYIYNTSHNYKTVDVPVVGIQKGDVFVKSGPQLLKVLVEGKASLLKNNDGIYFLSLEGETLKPLIYKRYIYNDKVEENVSFRLELYNALKCESLKMDDFKKLVYIDKQLVNVVNEYNKCQNSESKNYTAQKSKAEFNIKLVSGVNFYTTIAEIKFAWSAYGDSRTSVVKLTGNSESNFVAGFEAEVRLPVNNKKWALFATPTYNKQKKIDLHFIKGYDGIHYDFMENIYVSEYSYIEVPLGIRRYFILNRNSLINVNVSYGFSFNAGPRAELSYDKLGNTRNAYYKSNISGFSLLRIGTGYTFKERYTIGVNYYANKDLSKSNTNGSLSVLLGYKIL